MSFSVCQSTTHTPISDAIAIDLPSGDQLGDPGPIFKVFSGRRAESVIIVLVLFDPTMRLPSGDQRGLHIDLEDAIALQSVVEIIVVVSHIPYGDTISCLPSGDQPTAVVRNGTSTLN